MALEFLKGAQQPTAQEAVAFLTDDSGVADTYAAGEVAASVSDLVAVDGAEDVVAYVNDAGTSVNEVAEVTVGDNGIVLDVGSAGAAADANTVAVDGGLFFSSDETQTGEELNATEDYSGLDAETDYFAYEDNAGDPQTVVPSDGVPMVLQASGF